LVCIELASISVLYLGKGEIGLVPRRVAGNNPHGFASLCVQEGCGELSVVIILECSLAQPAAGYGVDGVGGATVDLDKHQQLLLIGPERIFYTDRPAAQHCHSDSEHLPGTHMTMGLLGSNQIFIERFHARFPAYPDDWIIG